MKNQLVLEYWRQKDGWYWHLKSANHEIIAQGESYRKVAGVKNLIRVLVENGLVFDVKKK